MIFKVIYSSILITKLTAKLAIAIKNIIRYLLSIFGFVMANKININFLNLNFMSY